MKNLSMILMGFIIGCLIGILVTLITNRSNRKISNYREYLKGYSEGLDYGVGVAANSISKPGSKWCKLVVNPITHDCFAITDTNVFVSHKGGDVFIGLKPSSNILWKGIK
jgi:hypothetical protein